MNKVPCPKCGYLNRPEAVACNLCRAILRTEGKKAERIARKIEYRSSFYGEQASNRRDSFLLLGALFALLPALGAAAFLSEGFDPLAGAGGAFMVASGLGAFSWFGGSALILNMSRAKKAAHDTHPQLFNVVEEMKIASGLPMPELYVIEADAPNAFATGRDQNHSAIAVTTGLLAKLNRDELQGVIAHEFSHIRNLDIRYAMLVGVIVGATALIADAFLRGFGGSGSRRGGLPLLLVAVIFAIVAPISAKMLQMAISRSREFLADASAVELTRNPDGLASALNKITRDQAPLSVANRATQHLYIVNPLKSFDMDSKALFSTHPPTEARIRKLVAMGARSEYLD